MECWIINGGPYKRTMKLRGNGFVGKHDGNCTTQPAVQGRYGVSDTLALLCLILYIIKVTGYE